MANDKCWENEEWRMENGEWRAVLQKFSILHSPFSLYNPQPYIRVYTFNEISFHPTLTLVGCYSRGSAKRLQHGYLGVQLCV
jgi:hypothetical protein